MPSQTQIYIVEDEPSVATAYARLVRSAKMLPRTFGSVEEFVTAQLTEVNACIISDIQFPGKSGLEIPALLSQAGYRLPIIFVTGYDTPASRDLAQNAGASGYFRKPVDDQALLDAIAWALSSRQE